jgi:hypothetical protein
MADSRRSAECREEEVRRQETGDRRQETGIRREVHRTGMVELWNVVENQQIR